MVWNGLRPGTSGFTAPASRLKLVPRFCHKTPVSRSTRPEPNSQYRLWMKPTARPAPSMAPSHTVSPGLASVPQGAARRGSIAAAMASSAFSVRKSRGSRVM